jgi:rhamnose utilization protein RhaD (predicted bifunctional aldolase and dehydrogenase)/NAD(P)-dependent dehydrogenase (short-subunit alcohol dehydrogenase family)
MRNRFREDEAAAFVARHPDVHPDLALRAYTSRLIGAEKDLVLHGGGNTSVKIAVPMLWDPAETEDVLFIKGSGRDLDAITPDGFTGLRLAPLRRLVEMEALSDEDLDNQLQVNKIRADAPYPSVESLLHAFLPYRFVDHTHANTLLALTNQERGPEIIREALGPKVAILPYAMSGLPMARALREAYRAEPSIEAVVFLHHGIFTFSDDANTAYSRMIDYVTWAEEDLARRIGGQRLTIRAAAVRLDDTNRALARTAQTLRGLCARSGSDGRLRRVHVEIRQSELLIEASLSEQARFLCDSGVITPDHVIRTKGAMLLLEDVPDDDRALREAFGRELERYMAAYEDYFTEQAAAKGVQRTMLDPLPRLALVRGLGLLGLGRTRRAAKVAADIGEHAIRVKLQSRLVGAYLPCDPGHLFDMEYWSLELKKLGRDDPLPLEGQAALVTGGGGAIGLGIADRLLSAGACVALLDIDRQRLEKVKSILEERFGPGRVEILVADVTDPGSMESAIREVSLRLGGVDILVPNAGIAHVSRLEDLDPATFRKVTEVNLFGTFLTIQSAIAVFRRQNTGGSVVVISTKNVFEPGASFGAYSATKAGAHQLAKIAALELADYGVRVNMINPDAVFGDEKVSSKLWDLVGPDRMKARCLDAEGLKEYYCQRNLLKSRVLAEHVGNAVVFFAAEMTPTTGASLPVDGGLPGCFPR